MEWVHIMKKTKSPLKSAPLRNPGQSLDEKLQDLIFNQCYSWFILALILTISTITEWARWFFSTPHQPITYTVLSFPIIAYSVYRFLILKARIPKLKQGRDGEKVVGQYLESFRASGGKVFHDIVGTGFNVDHVLICKQGIYSIETKTWSKPVSGAVNVIANNKELAVNGWRNQEAITQAWAEAKWIGDLLLDSTGKKLTVHPVILLPGWYVDSSSLNNGLWVLNPKGLPGFISHQPEVLTDEEVNFFSYSLSRYIRFQ